MKITVRFIKAEAIPALDECSSYIYLDIWYDRGEPRPLATYRKYLKDVAPADARLAGPNLAATLAEELTDRMNSAADQIAELRAIHTQYAC